MMTINEIVHSKLFLNYECRHIILPLITKKVKHLLEIKEEVSDCYLMLFLLLFIMLSNYVNISGKSISETGKNMIAFCVCFFACFHTKIRSQSTGTELYFRHRHILQYSYPISSILFLSRGCFFILNSFLFS